jgi:predicted RNA polymerase sigma factor
MTTARNRALDERRHRAMQERKHELLLTAAELQQAPAPEPLEQGVPDDVLRLILIACHPVLSKDARAALTLRLVAGLSVAEIARAFLASEVAIGQRIVRAKRTLGEARVPFELPAGAELHARIPAALEVIYLIFNEGYTATAGEDWTRPALCEEAMRLARMLAELAPAEAEAHGLLALLELQASRLRARVAANGEPVLLFDQDRSQWDRLLITRGLERLARAEAMAQPLGPYTLQAALAACHARANTPAQTDWARIVALYDALAQLTGSPVVELNRAVAVSMAFGPQAGLDLLDALTEEPALRDYHLLPAARADLLVKLGRQAEARAAFEKAAALTSNARERDLLLARAAACAAPHSA